MDMKFTDGVEQVLSTTAIATGNVLDIACAKTFSVQATVSGTGAVSATAVAEVSNDGIGWVNAGIITLAGTALASDGFGISVPWAFFRARCTAIAGTGARVTVTIGG
jgi:hypothetical protein